MIAMGMGLGLKIAALIIGIVLARIALYWLDVSMNKMAKKDNAFSRTWEASSNESKMLYYSIRFAAVVLAVAWAIS